MPGAHEIRAVIALPRGAVASFIKEPSIKLYEIHKYSVNASKRMIKRFLVKN